MLFERIAATRLLKLTVLAACGAGALAMYQPGHAQNALAPAPAAPAAAPAAPSFPDAAATDPVTAGWMQGFPPAAAKIISFTPASNGFPRSRWSFSHIRELVPTASVWHGRGPAAVLPRAEHDIGSVAFTEADGTRRTFSDMLGLTYTDGILVMHKGRVVYEKYFGALDDHTPHIAMSVTKSFVGTLAAMLVADGKLDPAAPVTRYLPEMAGTAYGDATVREVMDMTVGVKYSENYADPKAEIWDYSRAGGMMPREPGYAGPKTFYEFLATLKKEGEHDQAFAYKTVNAEVLAWIVKRVSGQSLAKLLSERVWQKMGAENDAYFMVDSIGSESGGGGLNTTLRDLARFGETMRNGGRYNGQQVIPAEVVADIRRGGDRAKFAKAGYATLPGWSYRSMWWVSNDDHGVFEARGIHGQRIYIDPKAELTIVRYASHPIAANGANDPVTHRAYRALALSLMK
ncbi:serine hydrolase domain-containing protein [Cupriavidus sp.]|uniref:serine hydrolase domain-containing protein n=1 Tax=Cupriavidus sp. TaxID=1873897 RepID=UPI003D0E1A4C